jgi:hypothetical protein
MVAMVPAFSQRIVVEKSNNATQAVDLHNFQRITFSGSTLNILQTNGTATSTEMSDIVRIYFDDYTRINEVNFNDGKELVAYISPDEIAVNCEAGEEIAIYNISGTMVLKERQNSEGGSISIANLPKGLYLLRAKSQTVKILKR